MSDALTTTPNLLSYLWLTTKSDVYNFNIKKLASKEC